MDWKIELVAIPVTNVDRAKAFYTGQVGFHADHDNQISDTLRFVQLTPPAGPPRHPAAACNGLVPL
jgi:catechol 2,3-dioxygenase-like lactoylglutathione lyase family enzyme